MATKQTSLFLPEEHRIISSWLGVEPVEEIPEDLTLEVALRNLGLDAEIKNNLLLVKDYAVASIRLERIQGSLPQWGSVRDEKVTLSRVYRDRAAERTVELMPKFLLMINWADSGPGFSWPESYHVTYVPLYDVHVVTGSVDCPDLYGVTDFAIGHFKPGGDIKALSGEKVAEEWNNLACNCQSRWAYVFEVGLIDAELAAKLADEIWNEEEEQEADEEITISGIQVAIKAAYPNLTDEQIEMWMQST